MEHKIKEEYKDLCQVFTPKKNVEQMLNWCNYEQDLYGKKVVENSCGEGNILEEIVKRYIEDCNKKSMSKKKIQEGLNRDIYAYETDEKYYKNCINKLNKLLQTYGLSTIKWENIYLKDALLQKQNNYFNFVIGNPPYIKYKSLKEDDRKTIRENFSTCKLGKFDYCYAFIQRSIDSLATDGKMAYLIPSSIFKNVFAQEIREYILPHLVSIYDYTTEKLFDSKTNEKKKTRLTSSVVMILEKGTKQDFIYYIDIVNKTKIEIKKEKLSREKKWIFTEREQEKKERLGDYFKVSNTIATLYNKAYVISEDDILKEDKKYIYLKDGNKLEKQIIKTSASPKKLAKGKKEKIIFPYDIKEEKIVRYKPKKFEEKYKYTCEYLHKFNDKLKKRKSDKNAEWYEYGRSQALESIAKPKLLISTVITKEVRPYILSAGTIPYSGIYIQTLKEKSLEEAEEILRSEEFFKYIKKIGIPASGESYRITSKDISNYEF